MQEKEEMRQKFKVGQWIQFRRYGFTDWRTGVIIWHYRNSRQEQCYMVWTDPPVKGNKPVTHINLNWDDADWMGHTREDGEGVR